MCIDFRLPRTLAYLAYDEWRGAAWKGRLFGPDIPLTRFLLKPQTLNVMAGKPILIQPFPRP
jgi:hypothetical protein